MQCSEVGKIRIVSDPIIFISNMRTVIYDIIVEPVTSSVALQQIQQKSIRIKDTCVEAICSLCPAVLLYAMLG